VSYDLDLFGRVSSSVHAATAALQQQESLYQSALLALPADVAPGYFLIRQLDTEQPIYIRTIKVLGETRALM
ncbi:RND transporter, partial [Acinetobacter baumannii]